MSTEPIETTAAEVGQAADENPAVKPFNQWLLEQRGGALHGELSEELQKLVLAVTEHEKPGTLTLVVKVKQAETGTHLLVADEVKVKAPEPDRGAALFFDDGHGNLSRRDPRQPQLPFDEVNARKAS